MNRPQLELAIISDEISLDLEEAIHLGNELGFRKYEIRCLDDYEHRVPNLNPGQAERIEALVAEGSIAVTAVSPGTFKIQPGETKRLNEEMESILPRACEMARRWQASRIITFAFLRQDGVEEGEILDHLAKAAQIADTFGLELSIENEPGSYCDTGVNTAAIVRAIGMPHVGINWDPANAQVSGEMAYPAGYAAALPHIQNVHLKDAVPIPPDKWENRLIGDGDVDWPGQMSALLNDRPVPHLTLETHVFPLLESTREDVRRLASLMGPSWKGGPVT